MPSFSWHDFNDLQPRAILPWYGYAGLPAKIAEPSIAATAWSQAAQPVRCLVSKEFGVF